MAGAVVGIDLGTTNTVVAVVRGGKAVVLADEEGNRLLPSVVSFPPSGEVLVGRKARERRLVDARNTVYSIKRLIGRSWHSDEVDKARKRFPFELREGPTHGPLVVARGETYTLPEISAFVLRRAKEIAEKALGETVDRAVVTVPASFNDLQRASTKVAAREAGLEVLRILNEPTAAALAYGFGKSGNERIAIYDFGGGTFDVTLLDLSGNVFEVIATAGDSFLGGDDIDFAIADKIAMNVIAQTRFDPRNDVQLMERLRDAAERIKITLSTENEASVDLDELGYGPGGVAISTKFTLTRGELETLIGAIVSRTFTVCAEAMQLARAQTNAFDNAILVGGSTRIPLVRRRVEDYFGRKPMDRVNPDEVVAVGAAIQGAALTGAERRRAATPAPIANPEAVKATRIQTLGGMGNNRGGTAGARGPLAPPPARTTGRIVAPPLASAEPDLPAQVAPAHPVTITPGTTEQSVAQAAGLSRLADESLDELTNPTAQSPLVRPVAKAVATHSLFQEPPTRERAVDPRLLAKSVPPPPMMPPMMPAMPPPAMAPAIPQNTRPSGIAVSPTDFGAPSDQDKTKEHDHDHDDWAKPPTAPPPRRPGPPPSTQMGLAADRRMPSLPPLPSSSMGGESLDLSESWPTSARRDFNAPLLIDVTPLSLAVETVGGYIDRVITRNTAVPCSQTRTFTTSTDHQQVIKIHVCQGESDSFKANTELGELLLSGLRSARRGEVNIEVTFELDADGILQVRARDLETSNETSAQMKLIGLDNPGASRAAPIF